MIKLHEGKWPALALQLRQVYPTPDWALLSDALLEYYSAHLNYKNDHVLIFFEQDNMETLFCLKYSEYL